MTYSEAISYLYNATPQFQQIGAAAYKPGLDTVRKLAALTGDSHQRYPIVHVGGTNGKGSTSHTLAAILQKAGYNTALFTSPHLIDFRERIRVNGEKISQDFVIEWLEKYIQGNYGLQPSFFELTTILAFDYFAHKKVDIAIVEVGLGGRLDSTNIITPILSVITNISKDHVAQLGESLQSIACEKAGIIKPGIPVIIGEAEQKSIRNIFQDKASQAHSPIIFANDKLLFQNSSNVCLDNKDYIVYNDTPYGNIHSSLTGDYQLHNANTILYAVQQLEKQGFSIPRNAVKEGFEDVEEITGLYGRWTIVSRKPMIVCDTGHNIGAWRYLAPRLKSYGKKLKMVIGFVNDKDIDSILSIMPADATYYFTQASVPRALKSDELYMKAQRYGLNGESYNSVKEAVDEAMKHCGNDNAIFIGGSTFVVADFAAAQRHDKELS